MRKGIGKETLSLDTPDLTNWLTFSKLAYSELFSCSHLSIFEQSGLVGIVCWEQ